MTGQVKHYYSTGGTFKGVRTFTSRGERDAFVADTAGAWKLKAGSEAVRAFLYAKGRGKRIVAREAKVAARKAKEAAMEDRRAALRAAMAKVGVA